MRLIHNGYVWILAFVIFLASIFCDTEDEPKKVDKTLFHCTLSEVGFWEAMLTKRILNAIPDTEILAAQEQSDPEAKYCYQLSSVPGHIDSLVNLCSIHYEFGSSSDYGPCQIDHRYKCVYFDSEHNTEYFTSPVNRELLQRYCEESGGVWTVVE